MKDELTKHSLFLYKGDFELLRSYYPEVGAGLVVRKLVRQHLKKLQKRTEEPVNIDVEVELDV